MLEDLTCGDDSGDILAAMLGEILGRESRHDHHHREHVEHSGFEKPADTEAGIGIELLTADPEGS